MRIEKTALDAQNRCVYSLYKEKGCIGHAVTCADCFEALEIAPEWQSRGYGSYLLREVLRQNGGFDRTAPSEFTAPLPDAGNTAAQALAAKFGFVPRGGPRGSPLPCPGMPRAGRWRKNMALPRTAASWCAAACRT